MNTPTSEALLLRSVDYAEADRIVTLLTRTEGKASFMARGARRSKKRFGGALQPFHLMEVELKTGRGSLGTLVQAQVTRAFPRILTDLQRMGAGFAALELVRELTPEHQPDAEIFSATLELLEALDAGDGASEPLLICFGLRLLALAGFAPQLSRCGICGRLPAPSQASAFDPGDGQLVCQQCGGATHRLGGELRAQMQVALGDDWRLVAQAPWPAAQIAQGSLAFLAFAQHRIGKRLEAAALLQRSDER